MVETAQQKREREYREDLQRLRDFRLIDDDLNGEYRGDDELGKLMYDFNCTDVDDMNYEQMAERTRYLKKDPEGVRMMCKAMEDMRDKARAEGRAEGRTEGMNIFALLIKRLSELGRSEDIERAAADAAYRNQLLVELSIQ